MPLRDLPKRIRGNVITGVLLLLPLFTTVYIFVVLFQLIDQALPKAFHFLLPSIMPERWPVPGIGVALTLLLAYFAGLAAKNMIGRFVIDAGNTVIANIPMVNKIYLGIQQIVDAMRSANKQLFERPVLVRFPRDGSYCIGFVTSQTTGELALKIGAPTVSVFVPTTPNPTSGFLLYAAESELVNLEMSVETAVKLVMSAGMVSTEQLRKTQYRFAATPKSSKGWNWLHLFRSRQTADGAGTVEPPPGSP